MPPTTYHDVPIYHHNILPLHPRSWSTILYKLKRYEYATTTHGFIYNPLILRLHLHSDHHHWFDQQILTLPPPIRFWTFVEIFNDHFSPSASFLEKPIILETA